MTEKISTENAPEKETLEEIVERYGRLKAEVNSYTKQINSDNSSIKSQMTKLNIKNFESENYVASYSVITSESFDEDKLISKLRSMTVEVIEDGVSVEKPIADALGLIEYKPVVKMDVLENAIYNGKISAASLSSCVIKNETGRLTIKERKNKE